MSSPRAGHYTGGFQVATYFPSDVVTRLLSDTAGIQSAIDGMKALQVEHVFLEVYRGGHEAAEETLARARDAFRSAGFRVGAGLTTTWSEGFGAPALPQPQQEGLLFCYSHPQTAADISRVCELAARLFDELMLDDFFFTNCECDACRAAKGDGPWWRAHNWILADFAAKAVLAPAHGANPNCRVIVKYPQWYDRFQQFGYDAVAQTRQFDAVWVGTETRDPHQATWGPVQQGQSWSVYHYLADLGGERTLGGWFDPYVCDVPSYIEQAYQTVLVGTREMLLFNYGCLQHEQYRPMAAAFVQELPRLRRWAESLLGAVPVGVACYKPPSSFPHGEYYVFDYLTMIGLPITMHTSFPSEARVAFVSGHALADRDTVGRLRKHVRAGGSVVASAEFVLGIGGQDAMELFGLEGRGSPAEEGPAQTTSIWVRGCRHKLGAPMEVAGLIRTAGAEVLASWGPDPRYAPYLTRKRHGHGSAMMMELWTQPLGGRTGVNMTRWVRFMDLPQEVLDTVRAAVTEPLGLRISAPGRVGLYCFEGGPLAVCNYRNEPASVEVVSAPGCVLGAIESLAAEPDSGIALERTGADVVHLSLPARSRVLLQPSR